MSVTEVNLEAGLAKRRNEHGFVVLILDLADLDLDAGWQPISDARSDRLERIWAPPSIIAAARSFFLANGRPPMAEEWRLVDPAGERPTVSQVLTVFGKWNDMLDAAGFTRRTGGRGNVSRPLEEVAA